MSCFCLLRMRSRGAAEHKPLAMARRSAVALSAAPSHDASGRCRGRERMRQTRPSGSHFAPSQFSHASSNASPQVHLSNDCFVKM